MIGAKPARVRGLGSLGVRGSPCPLVSFCCLKTSAAGPRDGGLREGTLARESSKGGGESESKPESLAGVDGGLWAVVRPISSERDILWFLRSLVYVTKMLRSL